MSLSFEILGGLQRDNALWVCVDGGQQVHRFLFDCGEGCLNQLTSRDILDLEKVFFSHLHMDHISGFDGYFRRTYQRDSRPGVIYGPPECAEVFHHRFQGFTWNHFGDHHGSWQVHEIHPEHLVSFGWEVQEAFRKRHLLGVSTRTGSIAFENEVLQVEAIEMDHDIPSMSYIVREKPKQNLDMSVVSKMGLRPGPWLQVFKKPVADAPETVEVGGESWNVAELREKIMVQTEGDSVTYLTDFLLDEKGHSRLVQAMSGVKTMVCESQYATRDLELAIRNHHCTVQQVATLAKDAGVEELVLMHLSERYSEDECKEILEEAQSIFPNTRFPEHWSISS